MKIYIAGKITGNPDYKNQFAEAEHTLINLGHSVMNPAWICAGKEFNYEDYMTVSGAMQKVCDAVFFLDNWEDSKGARREQLSAITKGQKQFYSFENIPQIKS